MLKFKIFNKLFKNRIFKKLLKFKIFQNTNEALNDRLEITRRVYEKIKSLGDELIKTWECDFNQKMTENQKLRQFAEKNNLLKIKGRAFTTGVRPYLWDLHNGPAVFLKSQKKM